MLRPSQPSIGGSSQTGGASGPVRRQDHNDSVSGPSETEEKQIRHSHMVPGICQPCDSPSVIQFDHEEEAVGLLLTYRWSFGCARIWGAKVAPI